MALWTEVAVSDMRIPGYGGSYSTSYATTDDTWWLRRSTSSQNTRASLVMGRYPTPEAFTSTNPDYASELIGFAGNTAVTSAVWTRIQYWNHVVLTGTHQNNHTTGWANNTRVMIWDAQVWVKSKATGQWSRKYFSDTPGGDVWEPNFAAAYAKEADEADYRIESSTGYPSVRLVSTTDGTSYYFWHGYGTIASIDAYDVADVLVSSKVSLVLNNPDGIDDRRASRFMFAVGADYYPNAALSVYPGVGTSRHKLVTALYPDFQYAVMHTMTEAQFNAAGGYPSAFVGLSEGSSGTGGGSGGGSVVWTPPVPSRANWFAKETAGANTWSTHAVSNVAPTKVRRGRRARMG